MSYLTSRKLNVPATRTATQQRPSTSTLELAKSLACYCSDDDASLDRRAFLIQVKDRIELDLSTGEH